jgi:hypothetical protein
MGHVQPANTPAMIAAYVSRIICFNITDLADHGHSVWKVRAQLPHGLLPLIALRLRL